MHDFKRVGCMAGQCEMWWYLHYCDGYRTFSNGHVQLNILKSETVKVKRFVFPPYKAGHAKDIYYHVDGWGTERYFYYNTNVCFYLGKKEAV